MIAEPVGTFLDFTGGTLRLMQDLIDKWGIHPFFVQLSREVVSLAGAKTPEDEAWAIWAWVRANVEYRRDPVNTQWVQDPFETAIKSRAGNCANMAVVAGTMLQAVGHPSRATAVHWTDRDDYSHAVAYDALTGRVVDPVSPTFDWPPGGKQVAYLVDADGLHHEAEYREDGRGLGFSIGGWHPFRINTYLPTLKKLDPLANTSIGKALWKPVEKINQSVNKDFAKAKVWSQEHRKQLQVAAAIAAAVVTAGFATGAIGAAEAAGAAEGAGAAAAEGIAAEGATTIATASMAPEILTAIPEAASLGVTSMLPAAVPGAVEGAGFFSALGTVAQAAGTIGKDALTVMSLAKMLGAGQQPQQQAMPGVSVSSYSTPGGGYSGGGGGYGGSPFPMDAGPATSPTLAPWVLPVGGLVLLFILTR